MNRETALKLLASWLDQDAIVVGSRSSIWPTLRTEGANLLPAGLGLCLPFAAGLSLSFPSSIVVALDTDGSLMLDTSSLITLAQVNPPNLVAVVIDNEAYEQMGPTATARGADLERMAQGAGLRNTATVRTEEELSREVPAALKSHGPHLFVVKVEPDPDRPPEALRRRSHQEMKADFLKALRHLPDFQGRGQPLG